MKAWLIIATHSTLNEGPLRTDLPLNSGKHFAHTKMSMLRYIGILLRERLASPRIGAGQAGQDICTPHVLVFPQ